MVSFHLNIKLMFSRADEITIGLPNEVRRLMFYGYFCAQGRLNGPRDLQQR